VYEDAVLTAHIATYPNQAERFRFEYKQGQLMNGSRRYPTGEFHETWNISTFTNPPILYYQQFDEHGKLMMKGPVSDTATRYGAWEFYNSDGVAIATGEYVNGQKEGTWTETNADGTQWKGEYHHGRKKGLWKGRRKNGDVVTAKF
jgi:antitoxin component YwqK of YwqJK toxin-antitoxin module